MKVCTKCGVEKALTDFNKAKAFKDGYSYHCRECTKKYHESNKERLAEKAKVRRIANADRTIEYRKKYHAENKEQLNAGSRDYYQSNKDRISENRRMRRLENIELSHQKEKRIRDTPENKERKREYDRKRRQTVVGRESDYRNTMRRRSSTHKVHFTPHQRKYLLERDNYTCQSCHITVHDRHIGDWNTPDKAHVDHIVPISKGGNSEPENLQILCRSCNLAKSDKNSF